ncbi:NADH-quinone oxidoreductase subunit L [Thermicanus aegyptius]|uniref:NADH-quinone oxidoreductase subunit L n=1 Tax=Thermicanus aegyptius TaxID=94009 RepID=UPI000423D288|nr:NADH-quinone oxidoreductase subunit L [Thermicanus aegyptius]
MEFTWLIPVFPLLSFLLLAAFGRQMKEKAHYVGIGASLLSFLLSLLVLFAEIKGGEYIRNDFRWINIGGNPVTFGFEVNPLNAMMLGVVSLDSLLIHLYSVGYMHGDERYPVFYQYLGLFTFAMLGLVISPNFLQTYIFWELVGLASFLLIGFYYYKPEATAAAKKAFMMTRIGDVGLFIAIILLFLYTGSFDYSIIFNQVSAGTIPLGSLTLIAILIFIGAVGKSGQFPLHTWLPDAMEGPTPVSALIHAATMVAAGVYLVAATYPIFSTSETALWVVAIIGGFTAIFAASIGLTQTDIKRVLAYSTVSQLGYMMLALGVGGYVAGVFHLFTHAFFKALLFLAAGSIIHALNTNEIYEMGGLRKRMPVTFTVFLIGALALSGIPPFAGYFSKEMVLSAAYEKNFLLFLIALVTVFFTAVYMFKLVFVAFTGEPRHTSEVHESPWVMTFPMVILAVLSTVAGWINTPWFTPFGDWLLSNTALTGIPSGEAHEGPLWVTLASILIALFGIYMAYLFYRKHFACPIVTAFPFLHKLSRRKFYVDELYDFVFVRGLKGLGVLLAWFDRFIVGGMISLVIRIVGGIGALHARVQNGQVQLYGAIVFFGLTLLLLAFTFFAKGVLG